MGQFDGCRKRAGSWCLATLLLSACTAFQPISSDLSIGQNQLEVQFAPPSDLVGRTADGATIVRRGVRRVVGRPVALRTDSLALEVARSFSSDSWGRESRPFVVMIRTTDASIAIGTRRRSGGRTAALILSIPAAAWIMFGILYDSR
jgi:hypothetical protein